MKRFFAPIIAGMLAGLNCLFPMVSNQHFMKTKTYAKS